MIVYVKGDLLNDDAEALVNAVNTVGVMGKGLAYQFKEKFHENFLIYRDVCKKELLSVGKVLLVETDEGSIPNYIINFPTKAHWRGKSKIEYIEEGLNDLIKVVKENQINSVALPALGSGLGGLPWSQVERVMLDKLSNIENIEWRIYAPNNTPNLRKKLPLTEGRSILIYTLNYYLRMTKKQQLTELEIHCLMYLLQCNGLSLTGIKFNEFREVPFSDVLHVALSKMDGDFLYISGVNKPIQSSFITLESKIVVEAKKLLQKKVEKIKKISDVMELISGYESKDGMAIISTALWVANENKNANVDLANTTLDIISNNFNSSNGVVKGAFVRLYEEKWLPLN
ncbi:ADP-ribose-binding protein [Aliivibrio salmonicida]|uniref:Macro domain-containing protein n=1 Tax=Aliivibrio salmonicida (strain LFI1238) TaxID=316275 RepID=B6ELL4_ALISL|nr:macro domain-containing protein [Aliivibrio salmonicida]AZL86127.1 ADP-ribose-binding protein [Aliivibrio salmonicida]CAQ78076.1 hypothetical protein, ADP-ribose binding protein [Aliivibrio salmonicida LFI1238]